MDIWFTLFVMAAAVMVAVGGALLLVSYLQILPASFDHGWQVFAVTLVLPIFGPLWFARGQRPKYDRPAKQLVAGFVLLLVVASMLFFFGPYFVERVIATAKMTS